MALGLTATGCASLRAEPRDADSRAPDRRASVIAHAQVWRPTDVRAIDFRKGPGGPGSFAWNATVYCDYIDKQLEGRSPKFACEVAPGDEVKVKFGGTNGEVYGEVLATRLLWALGFGADRMYPVRVVCRGCPSHLGGIARPNDEQRFDPAVIERRMAGTEWPPDGRQGWSWTELDRVDSEVGAPPLLIAMPSSCSPYSCSTRTAKPRSSASCVWNGVLAGLGQGARTRS